MDKNLALSFTIAGQEMGSQVPPGVHKIAVEAFNTTGQAITRVTLIKNGKPMDAWDAKEKHLRQIHTTVAAAGDYFYVVVAQENGLEAISSPIWVG
jgi:hypothetical protein